MSRCEDYPACGHTVSDPCDYRGATGEDMLADPARYHIGCDHSTGYCEYEDDDDMDEEEEDCEDHDRQCLTCFRTWNSVETPTPAARCPYEYDHDMEEE